MKNLKHTQTRAKARRERKKRARKLFEFYNECGEKYPQNKHMYTSEPAILRANTLVEILSRDTNALTLDLGCGEGYYFKHIPNYVGLDIAVGYLARFGGNNVWGIAEGLPFADRSFDRILASEVLEHTYDRGGILRECHRILKDKGLMIVSTPYSESEKQRFKIQKRFGLLEKHGVKCTPYVHGAFTESYMRTLLKESGFKVKTLKKTGLIPQKPKQRYIIATATKK